MRLRVTRALRLLPALPALLIGWLLLPAPALADAEPLFQFPQVALVIRSPKGHSVRFQVWVADTPRREEQGLMFVRDLDEHGGMLFNFQSPQLIPMWMKNTYISLDMLFLDGGGRIDHIAARTTPLSLDLIRPPRPAVAVLELKGGAAEHLGIHPGDVVELQQTQINKPQH